MKKPILVGDTLTVVEPYSNHAPIRVKVTKVGRKLVTVDDVHGHRSMPFAYPTPDATYMKGPKGTYYEAYTEEDWDLRTRRNTLVKALWHAVEKTFRSRMTRAEYEAGLNDLEAALIAAKEPSREDFAAVVAGLTQAIPQGVHNRCRLCDGHWELDAKPAHKGTCPHPNRPLEGQILRHEPRRPLRARALFELHAPELRLGEPELPARPRLKSLLRPARDPRRWRSRSVQGQPVPGQGEDHVNLLRDEKRTSLELKNDAPFVVLP
jgi:hypothetical protein